MKCISEVFKMQVEEIKMFLYQYKMYNENEINKLDKEEDREEIGLIWGILHGIDAVGNFIETMEKIEKK